MEQRDYNVYGESDGNLSAPLTSLQAAVQALNTLQSNYAIVKAIRDSGRSINENAIPEMLEWLRKVGYSVRLSPSIVATFSAIARLIADSVPAY